MAIVTNTNTGRRINTAGPLGGRILRANIRRNGAPTANHGEHCYEGKTLVCGWPQFHFAR